MHIDSMVKIKAISYMNRDFIFALIFISVGHIIHSCYAAQYFLEDLEAFWNFKAQFTHSK